MVAISQKLPSYMIPSRLVMLEQLPLTANGKVDRKSLTNKVPEKEIKVSLPETQAQRVLADFVCEVLQCEEVSIDEKLFDMGANSLHILLLQGKVEKTFHIKMNVVNFFEYTTIRELAEFITGNQEDTLIHRQAMKSADKRKAKAHKRTKK
jgi:acyl carrier protein